MIQTSKSFARFLVVVLLLKGYSHVSTAQQQPFSGTPAIEHSLRKLNELGTVLMIAAHPDDERTGVLAYFARGRHMRTAYLSLTRGEGGQNLIGSEQGTQLGIIRTQELLAARKIDGAEQFFTRAIDFGFTKTAAETLQKWGHDRILSDVAWVIRSYRPDVIILGFSGTPLDGHGQHQVSAMLGKEAFAAAADPSKFPEQLKYVQPWKTTRIVYASFRAFFGGRGQPPMPPELAALPELPKAGHTETGNYNPILGYSYEELATLSRSMHHSQGTGAMRRPGPSRTDYELEGGKPMTGSDLFEGIDTTWNRLPGGAAVAPVLAEAIRAFEPAHPEKSIPFLAKARPLIAAIQDPLAKEKLKELDETTAECAGIWIEAQAASPEITPGARLKVTTTVLNRSSAKVTFESAEMEGVWDETNAKRTELTYNQPLHFEFEKVVPASQPYTQPYWLAKPRSGDVYTVDDQKLIGLPDTPPAAGIRVRLNIDGTPVELVRPVHYRYAERAEGERTRPLVVIPEATVSLPETVALFPSSAPRKVEVAVRANVAKADGEVRLDLPPGWKAEPRSQHFLVAEAGEQQEVTFEVTPPAGSAIAELHAVARINGHDVAETMKEISYPHFPVQTLFTPSDVKAVRADVRVTAHKIGYIAGAGDDMPEALKQLGLDVTLLTPSDLEQGDLSRYDAIVAGVRAYSVRADLRANHPRLMQYVKNGGTYVVQYQNGTAADPRGGIAFGPAGAPLMLGPYPITIPGGNRYRVTVEDSPVTFPNPDSPLLQAPNHISEKDFEGWVQERGLYFATGWDKRYETVISSHDPGEEAMAGGELWTRYGKGVYIFTAYSWFRQLPAGVPGAYRLFANMLSAK